MKLLEENIGSKLFGIALSNILLDVSQAKETKEKNKWDYIQLKSFGTVNKPSRK